MDDDAALGRRLHRGAQFDELFGRPAGLDGDLRLVCRRASVLDDRPLALDDAHPVFGGLGPLPAVFDLVGGVCEEFPGRTQFGEHFARFVRAGVQSVLFDGLDEPAVFERSHHVVDLRGRDAGLFGDVDDRRGPLVEQPQVHGRLVLRQARPFQRRAEAIRLHARTCSSSE